MYSNADLSICVRREGKKPPKSRNFTVEFCSYNMAIHSLYNIYKM